MVSHRWRRREYVKDEISRTPPLKAGRILGPDQIKSTAHQSDFRHLKYQLVLDLLKCPRIVGNGGCGSRHNRMEPWRDSEGPIRRGMGALGGRG